MSNDWPPIPTGPRDDVLRVMRGLAILAIGILFGIIVGTCYCDLEHEPAPVPVERPGP